MSSSTGPFPESSNLSSAPQTQSESRDNQALEASQTAEKPETHPVSQENHSVSLEQSSEEDSPSSAAPESPTEDHTHPDSSSVSEKPARQQPIPPPSEPMQYRAIGLVRGRYLPSEEQFNRGELITEDGVTFGAVLLGRVTSLVKKHLDPDRDHLWVVYPRTREKRDDLHVQIVGVWEPENLQKPDEVDSPEAEESDAAKLMLHAPQPRKNYFSIRGEIVYYEEEEKKVIVKIVQAAKRASEESKSFKLTLQGKLSGQRTVGHFWDLRVERQGENLVIQNGERIAMIPPSRKKKSKPMKPISKRGPSPVKRPNRSADDRPYSESSDRPHREFSERPRRPEPRDSL